MTNSKQSQPLDELKRCPFCGEKPEALEITGQEDKYPIERYWVRCTCEVEQVGLFTRAGAIKAWNTRIPSTPPQSDNHGELVKRADEWLSYTWPKDFPDEAFALITDMRNFIAAQPEHIVDTHELVRPDWKGIAEKLAGALETCGNGHNSQDYYQYFHEELVHEALTEYRALTESNSRMGE